VLAGGAEGAADADFAGALDDGGEHDVHDADAADDEGDAGDEGGDELEGQGRLLGVFEELVGNDHGVVDEAGVADRHDAGEPGLLGHDLFACPAGDVDLGDLDIGDGHVAAAALEDDVAVNSSRGGQGDVDILVEVAADEGAA
jgi:hypothetical protein